ncbi:MAG TPA: hypothetical protein VN328_09100 [Thermodesulfovibrionales bacterium]|nr:hypothetical protein [Thermodesulfovibrionales bacterium]
MIGKGLSIAITSLTVFFMSLLLSGCPGSMPPPCCPKIKAAKVSDPWVCPANCPGGGRTRGIFEVEFLKGNERCSPTEEVKISIKNLTDGVVLPPVTLRDPGTGIYEGTEDIRLTKDTDFEVSVTAGGDKRCVTASGKLRVDVVEKGDFFKLCFSGPLTCTKNGSKEMTGYEPFGPGVLIDYVENLDSLKVGVRKDNSSDHLPPYYQHGTGLSGLEASGQWAVWLESETDCSIYNARPANAQELCLKVFLKCNCK